MALYASGASLLLHGNGADGSTTFTDETGKTVTPYGNARISTAQSKFGGASMYFDGTGDYLSIPHSADVNLTSVDWTVEAWFYCTALASTNQSLFDKDGVSGVSYSQYTAAVAPTGKLVAFVGNGNGVSPAGNSYNGVTTVVLNTWHHVALVKSGTQVMLFLDGALDASGASPAMYDGGKPLLIGWSQGQPASSCFKGYIDDLRITKASIYTAAFTPPTAPLVVDSVTQVNIQAVDPGLTDRQPYGPYKTPAVFSEFKGRGRITGTVAEKALPANTPLRRLVRLHREPDGMFIAATWSDATTGEYVFNGIRPDCKYTVTSFDYSGTYRAVIADNLNPTPV